MHKVCGCTLVKECVAKLGGDGTGQTCGSLPSMNAWVGMRGWCIVCNEQCAAWHLDGATECERKQRLSAKRHGSPAIRASTQERSFVHPAHVCHSDKARRMRSHSHEPSSHQACRQAWPAGHAHTLSLTRAKGMGASKHASKPSSMQAAHERTHTSQNAL